MKPETIGTISQIFKDSFGATNFVKSKISGCTSDDTLKHITIKLVKLKSGLNFQWVYSYKTKDITKNYSLQESITGLKKILPSDFKFISVITTTATYQYDPKKDILRRTQVLTNTKSLDHNKVKTSSINASENYLYELGITSENKLVKKDKKSKFKQINKYIEIIDPVINTISLGERPTVRDMGCGKGYLTFGLYQYLIDKKTKPQVIGVEVRPDIITKCNAISEKLKFEGLRFEEGYISDYPTQPTDILIALHACDTATDDAIAYGINSQAKLIICSPCCHKQVRKAMASPKEIVPITKHGILKERQAEILTDTIRALILEYHGYSTKVMEFISTEHTPKNLLIIGTKKRKEKDTSKLDEINALKDQFGITEHYLEKLVLHQ